MDTRADLLFPALRAEVFQMTSDIDRIDLSPPEPRLDGRHLDDLISLWLEHCAGRLTAATVEGYAAKIMHFRRWWAEVGPPVDFVLYRSDLARFEEHLRSVTSEHSFGNLSYNSRNDVLRRLRQMFAWAYENHYTKRDYSTWVPAAEGEPPKRKAVTEGQLERLFLAAGRSPYPYRDQTILALLIGTGIRRSECVSLDVTSLKFFHDNSGVMTVLGKRTRKNRTGRRDVAFDAATGMYVRAYLAVHELRSGPLFYATTGPHRGERLTAQGLYKVVKRLIADAGLEAVVQGCHDLRRAFATHMARQAKKNETASDMLRRQMGHAKYEMTSEYTLLEAEDLRVALNGHFVSPMARIAPRDGVIRVRTLPR